MKTLSEIENTFGNFMDGCRVQMLILRRRDGAVRSDNDFYKKIVTTNKEEFLKGTKLLLEMKEYCKNDKLRLYSCVNSRDINKGIRELKRCQLEADYYDEVNKNDFYLRIKDRWISALMKPSSRKDNYFLLDCDTLNDDNISEALDEIENLDVEIVHHYKTKSGFHVIVKPTNPIFVTKLSFITEVKKDSLLLLDY